MKPCPFCAEEIQDAAIVCKHCGRELTQSAAPRVKPSLSTAATVTLAIIAAAVIFTLIQQTSVPFGSGPGVTLSQFSRLSDGMTYRDAVQILGSEGTETTRSSVAGITTVLYTWPGSGVLGANMNAMFQDGKLTMKAQFGLQ